MLVMLSVQWTCVVEVHRPIISLIHSARAIR